MVTKLGHVGIICNDFLKMRDFYTRVIGLTITDEDPDRGSCFLSADPENEHHELALGRANGAERPKTQGLGQVSFIVKDLDSLKKLYQRLLDEKVRIDRCVTHGISCSVYFYDPEDNRVELYYKTGYNVKQGFSQPIDLKKQSNAELLAFSQSFEATQGPFQGAKLPVGRAR
ncbi:MAG: glyoxalase [SAR202 cluster bacterium]|nr:glyoxalase [SAR202 cluster bacterium]